MSEAVLAARRVWRIFGGGRTLLGTRRPAVHAVRGVDLELREQEILGLVGESGCGKSTLARMLVGLDRPSSGTIHLHGRDITGLAGRDPRPLASRVQYVFQDAAGALNPRKRIRSILDAPMRHVLRLDTSRRRGRVLELMEAVRLDPEHLERYPHELSGGQAQRVGIARALAAQPRILILDEPVSALDVSVQAQVLSLLTELRARFALTYLLISHDLSVVESICDRVDVMYFGRIVETGTTAQVFHSPRHPYTRLLVDSAPSPGRRDLPRDEGSDELPDPFDPPPGCAFAPRCSRATAECRERMPELGPDPAGNAPRAACFHPLHLEGASATPRGPGAPSND